MAYFLFLLKFKLPRWRLLGLLHSFFPSGKIFFLAGQVERKRRNVKCNKSVLVSWAAELLLGRQKLVSTLIRGWVCEVAAVTSEELKTDWRNVGGESAFCCFRSVCERSFCEQKVSSYTGKWV